MRCSFPSLVQFFKNEEKGLPSKTSLSFLQSLEGHTLRMVISFKGIIVCMHAQSLHGRKQRGIEEPLDESERGE